MAKCSQEVVSPHKPVKGSHVVDRMSCFLQIQYRPSKAECVQEDGTVYGMLVFHSNLSLAGLDVCLHMCILVHCFRLKKSLMHCYCPAQETPQHTYQATSCKYKYKVSRAVFV